MSDQIDTNQLANALQQKVDLPSGKSQADIDYVVEYQVPTAANNYTWYRKYKSGWVEQGGTFYPSSNTGGTITTVPLLKEMANTNYTVLLCIGDKAEFNANVCAWYTERNTTSVKFQTSLIITTQGIGWEVKGFAAQS